MPQTVRIRLGDCLDVLRTLAPCSVQAVVCDPPYGIELMSQEWDAPWKEQGNQMVKSDTVSVRVQQSQQMETWYRAWLQHCFDALISSGVIKVFGATRMFHRLGKSMEDIGFVDLHQAAWVYTTGFPKGLNVGKAVDEAEGVTEWDEMRPNPSKRQGSGKVSVTGWGEPRRLPRPVVQTAAGKQWDGFGTALKPAYEPVLIGRKP